MHSLSAVRLQQEHCYLRMICISTNNILESKNFGNKAGQVGGLEQHSSSIFNSDDKREIIEGSSPGGGREGDKTFEIIYNKKDIRFSIYV